MAIQSTGDDRKKKRKANKRQLYIKTELRKQELVLFKE